MRQVFLLHACAGPAICFQFGEVTEATRGGGDSGGENFGGEKIPPLRKVAKIFPPEKLWRRVTRGSS